MENQAKCPKCQSVSLNANKKGFSGGKALTGVLLTGGVGALAGTIGSKDIVITCLNCGWSGTVEQKLTLEKIAAKKNELAQMSEEERKAYQNKNFIIYVVAGLLTMALVVWLLL